MAEYQNLIFDLTDQVATITLNRPDAANAIDLNLGMELMQAAVRCDEDPEIRAVVLTGAGKMFCAGGDLNFFAGFGDDIGRCLKEVTTFLHAAVSRFVRMEAPVIVAVNGPAAGAGFSLAIAGDMVLASETAVFTMAYTAAGLSPDGGSSYFLPRLVGLRRSQELMLTNRRLSAQEALEWQLISRVVSPDQLGSEAFELATRLAGGATRAYGTAKKLLLSSFENGLETQMTREAEGIAAMASSDDGREGVRAFLTRRAPRFQGK